MDTNFKEGGGCGGGGVRGDLEEAWQEKGGGVSKGIGWGGVIPQCTT